MQKNPFELASNSMFRNPHFTEMLTFPGKGAVPAIRAAEKRELIRSKFGVYEDIDTYVTVQKQSFAVVGIPKKGDLCYFDQSPDQVYRVIRSEEDSASRTVDIYIAEYINK